MGREGAPVLKFLLFGLFCLLFAAWLTITLGNITVGASRSLYTAQFTDASGLLVNDDVKIAGVTVGKVAAIAVDDGGAARVTFAVDDSIGIPEDSTVQIRWRDAFGLRFLYVNPGTSEVLASAGDEGVHFRTDQTLTPTSIGTFLNRITPFITALDPALQNQVIQALQGSIVGREDEIREIVSDGAELTAALASRDTELGRLLDNASTILDEYAQRGDDIRALVDSLVDITETLARRNDTLDTAVTALADLQEEFGTLVRANEDDLRLALDALEVTTTTLALNRDQLDLVLERAPSLIIYHRVSRLGQWFNVRAVATASNYQTVSSERGAELPPRDQRSNATSLFRAPLGLREVQ